MWSVPSALLSRIAFTVDPACVEHSAACSADAWLRSWKAVHDEGSAQAAVFRPARDHSIPTASRIPRNIVMTTGDTEKALKKHGEHMHSWVNLNPEYDWFLFDEDTCSDFVRRFCSPTERLAYFRAIVGAQRADLFRVYYLRWLECRQPHGMGGCALACILSILLAA